uniref:NADH dehydrogenase subunit 6 n=1 Tax=Chamaepsila testudinaria TaxID=2963718 RepID=UPI0021139F32|nr:NADH dehydrogenase subunit 6 [Chamaepsila testudinaria]UTM10308.1 NADH dehydrogenase subunit 6 [Chamaepsila testudinaria]
MMQMLLYSTITIINIIFMQMNHPLAMGIMMLIQTIMISMITGLIAKTFWFSYILFLTFIGGMLVLFIYVTSLASNEMFSFSTKLTLILFCLFAMMFIISIISDKSYIIYYMNNEMNSIYNMNSYIKENSLSLIKMYNYPTNLITILLMNYLLMTLIVVVKITNLFYGPLRSMN